MLIFGGWHPWCPGQAGENLDTDVEGNPEERRQEQRVLHKQTQRADVVKQRQKEENNAGGVIALCVCVCLENVGIFPALLPG